MDSVSGFCLADVVNKLNGRLDIAAAKEATEFLMVYMHIYTTNDDDRYKFLKN